MSHDILARLEAVAARLEGYASAVASGAVHSSSSSSSSGSSTSIPREVEDYDHFYNDAVVPFVEAAKKSEETKEIAEWAEQSFQFVRRAILASKQCKKPTDKELSDFCAPLTKVVTSCQKCSRKVPNNHAKAIPEAIQSVSWIAQGGNARQFCQDQLEAADFWLIKIMKEGKDNNKPEFTEFATKLKQLLQKQKTFVDDNFRQGLEWNPKGVPLSSFKDSGSASAHGHGHGHGDSGAGAPPPPPGPPGDYSPDAPGPPPPTGDYSCAPAKPSAAGMGAVFDELCKKGDGVTQGLKKITKDVKAKWRAETANVEVKKKEPVAPAKAAATKAPEVKKEPKLYLSKGTWFVENYENGQVTFEEKIQTKENVYIMKCKNTTVIIPDKCKSIQIDGCVRTNVHFQSVVSLAEIFNSQRVSLHCEKTVPSVAIDKSSGCQVWLSREGVATPPDIITSSVSELNLVVPGKTDDDDPIEIPLPEQYITKYKGGMTLVTEPVTHGSNG